MITKKQVEHMLDGSMAADNPTIADAVAFTKKAAQYELPAFWPPLILSLT